MAGKESIFLKYVEQKGWSLLDNLIVPFFFITLILHLVNAEGLINIGFISYFFPIVIGMCLPILLIRLMFNVSLESLYSFDKAFNQARTDFKDWFVDNRLLVYAYIHFRKNPQRHHFVTELAGLGVDEFVFNVGRHKSNSQIKVLMTESLLKFLPPSYLTLCFVTLPLLSFSDSLDSGQIGILLVAVTFVFVVIGFVCYKIYDKVSNEFSLLSDYFDDLKKAPDEYKIKTKIPS